MKCALRNSAELLVIKLKSGSIRQTARLFLWNLIGSRLGVCALFTTIYRWYSSRLLKFTLERQFLNWHITNGKYLLVKFSISQLSFFDVVQVTVELVCWSKETVTLHYVFKTNIENRHSENEKLDILFLIQLRVHGRSGLHTESC